MSGCPGRCAERAAIILRVATGRSADPGRDAAAFAASVAADMADLREAAAARLAAARARLMRR